MDKIHVEGSRLIDSSGNEVLLHGINFVCKDEKNGYLWPDADSLLHKFSDMGFNFIRLGIFWNACEPDPGVFDDEYLTRVREVIRAAEENEIYVLLDMHQDLFSCLYGDGAPAWATLTDGKTHPDNCTMWYDAYLQSEAIIAAADHFWKNDQAPDNIGLVDHYRKLWQHIATHLADCDNIVGAEVMNEPFMGSIARNSFGMATWQVQQQYPEFDLIHQQGITPESQGLFTSLVGENFVQFDRETMMPFYNNLNAALREVWDIPFVTGGNIYCSSMFPTGLERVKLPDGQEEKQQIYDIHAYDAIVDTNNIDNYNMPLMEIQLTEKRATQERLDMPVILGEWGAFPSMPFARILINHMNSQIEKYLWNSAYWWYLPGFETDPNYHALIRAYPMRTEGILNSYHWDSEQHSLSINFEGKSVACFIPKVNASIDAAGSCSEIQRTQFGSIVKVSFDDKGIHQLTIQG